MRNERSTPDTKFRKILFNFYMSRQDAVENFKDFNRLMGGTGVVLSAIVGGPIGWSLAAVAGTAAIINEVRMTKQHDKNHDEHQKIIMEVYDYKKDK